MEPRPAATLALLREGTHGLEVLLLRRTPRARFIPGAFVFPGGRVDREDSSEATLALLSTSGADPSSRLLPFVAAALRETLEETGLLVGTGPGGDGTMQLDSVDGGPALLKALRAGETPFHQALEALGRPALPAPLTLIGHWVTPVQERYRYDTRFFAAQVPSDCRAIPDGRELVEAVWLTPEEALARNREGILPMVFPTVRTLETLLPFAGPTEALAALDRMEIPRLLPRVEETRDGIRMVV